jgi:dienelactone hydrolase
MLACAALVLGTSPTFAAAATAPVAGQPAAQVSVGPIKVHPIEVENGQFDSDGKPVEDFYCVPPAPGTHPAIILLHGAVPRGYGNEESAEWCRKFAAAGYYAMFVEYYSQACPARPGDRPVTGKGFAPWVNENFSIWTREVADGIDALGRNPTIERDRIALIGRSLGAFLALAVGASEGGRVAAVVEYYGGMNNSYIPLAANMPSTLILHGGADSTILVATHMLSTDCSRNTIALTTSKSIPARGTGLTRKAGPTRGEEASISSGATSAVDRRSH